MTVPASFMPSGSPAAILVVGLAGLVVVNDARIAGAGSTSGRRRSRFQTGSNAASGGTFGEAVAGRVEALPDARETIAFADAASSYGAPSAHHQQRAAAAVAARATSQRTILVRRRAVIECACARDALPFKRFGPIGGRVGRAVGNRQLIPCPLRRAANNP